MPSNILPSGKTTSHFISVSKLRKTLGLLRRVCHDHNLLSFASHTDVGTGHCKSNPIAEVSACYSLYNTTIFYERIL